MNFSFTEEQRALRDSVARTLAKHYGSDARQTLLRSGDGHSTELWTRLRELGLLALPFAEDMGGLGASIVDVVAVAEMFGEALFLEPYLSSVLLAGKALASATQNDAARAWLTRIVAGEALAAFAHEEGRGTSEASLVALRATESKGSYTLDGEKRHVLGAAGADVLVVTARAGGVPGQKDGLVLVFVETNAPGVSITPFSTIDGLSAARVRFDGTPVEARGVLATDAWEAIEDVIACATVALGAAAVGAMGVLLKTTADYAAGRTQFGVPIATFQAVAHRLADMKIAYTKARATLLYTTALAEAGQAGRRDIAILKGQVGKLGLVIGESSVQIHGGAGMTDEVVVGHYLKRLLAIDAMFGNADFHFRTIGAGPA